MPPLTRRRFLLGVGAAGAAAAGGALYTRFAEPHWLEISRTTVPLSPARGEAPVIRIAHLSDFHASPVVSLEYIADAVKRTYPIEILIFVYFTLRV